MQPATYLTCLFTTFCYRGIQQHYKLCPIGCDCIGKEAERSFSCQSSSVVFITTYTRLRTLHLSGVKEVSTLPSKQTLLLNCDNLVIDKANDVKWPKEENINVNSAFVTIINSDLKSVEKYFRFEYDSTKVVHFENIPDLQELWFTHKFPNLISFTILKSPIESITFSAFYWMPNVESLVIRHTKINGILSSNWFRRKMDKLKYLDLSKKYVKNKT
ncbi:hypothetical protein B4U80_14373 [Leptotrombidium deliense]|uniref:Uncharacterized protein n=1 Tax=Leptotrombidium deliense TaxID=299467 RepID=A0A443RWL8_9ACAR|nr:hypothetical protein B4U80_14373 [Leptotrombidium deliense]